MEFQNRYILSKTNIFVMLENISVINNTFSNFGLISSFFKVTIHNSTFIDNIMNSDDLFNFIVSEESLTINKMIVRENEGYNYTFIKSYETLLL